ncbi:MAG: hypothetical protein KAH18_11655 [Psychromonas sp.]|nr:hypothetical protein [Psychromonas sp.]
MRRSRAQRFPLSSEKHDRFKGELFDEADHIILTEEPDDIERAVDHVEKDTQEKSFKKHTKKQGRRALSGTFLV